MLINAKRLSERQTGRGKVSACVKVFLRNSIPTHDILHTGPSIYYFYEINYFIKYG